MRMERGFRGKLSDHLSVDIPFQVKITTNGSAVYDTCCFCVDAYEKLSDDRYMVFYNQPVSPKREISYSVQGNTADYLIQLTRLPSAMEKLIFTVSVDGSGTMGQIQSNTVQVMQNGQTVLETVMHGSDFQNERAIICIEIYRKNVWRIALVARGFNGGLGDLLRSFGGEEAEAAPLQSPPAANPQVSQKALYHQNQLSRFDRILFSLRQIEVDRHGEKHNRNLALDLDEINYKNMTASTPLHKLSTFIAIDVETTGIKVSGTDIIEVAAVKFVDFEPVEIFTTLIKPRKPIPPEATKINHITDDMVADAPLFYEIIPSLDAFLQKYPLVAHNAPFDVKHLFVNGLDSIAKKTIYDTLDLSKRLCKDAYDHKLTTLCNDYNIFFDDAHRASADALACGLLFVEFIKERHGAYSVKELQEQLYMH